MRPHADPIVLLTCLALACGGRTSLVDSDATNTVGGASHSASSIGTSGTTGGRTTSSAGGAITGDGGFVAYTGGVRATGGSSIGMGATKSTGSTSRQTGGNAGTGGVTQAMGGASSTGGTRTASGGTRATGGAFTGTGRTSVTGGAFTGTGGTHVTGGTFTGTGGTNGTGGTLTAQGGNSVSSGGASSQGGVSASGGTRTVTGGVTASGGASDTASTSGGTAANSSATSACEGDRVLCGTGTSARCVDTLTDPENCGQCGQSCTRGVACWYGVCDMPRCQPTFKMGGMPTVEADRSAVGLAVGDFNGDGNLDFATANSDVSTVSVLLGNGNGTWGQHVDYATGKTPTALAVGDFNRDGKQDIVTANVDANSVSVLLGLGDGTLASAVQYPVGAMPQDVSIDDFNGDGTADIATANRYSDSVSILLGADDGKFATKVDYPAGTWPDQIVTGDFNGDGKRDVITNGGPTKASVLLGAGTGTFMAPSSVPAGSDDSSVGLALGDLNSDGNQDLIVGRANGRWVPGAFGVFFGAGDGSFLPMVDYAAGSARAIAAGDLNGDGKLELVVSVWQQSLSIFTLEGDGSMAAAVSYPTPAPAGQLAIGDFNGDHWLDIAALDRWGIYVLLATGNGKFDAPTSQPTGTGLENVLLRDLDGDTHLDLAAIGRDLDTATSTMQVQLGLGDGTFAGSSAHPIRYNDGLIEAGDLDGDGQPDLVTAHPYESGVSVLWNSGHASYPSRTDYATATGTDFLALGDLDNNGKVDILASSVDVSSQVSTVTVLLNAGGGSFVANVYNDSVPWGTMALADLNHDGKLDLVQSDGSANGVAARLGLGDGSFGTWLPSATNDLSIVANGAAIGDLNGDGHLDLVSVDVRGTSINVLLGVGDGTFTSLAPQPVLGAYDIERLSLGDLNGDGILDLVSNGRVSWVGYEIVVLLGAGDGTFSCVTASLPAGAYGDYSALGDVNGDNRLDLVVPNPDAKTITVLLNQTL